MFDEKFMESQDWYFYAKLRDGAKIYQQEVDEDHMRYSIVEESGEFSRISEAGVKERVNLPYAEEVEVFPGRQIMGNDGELKPLKYGSKAFKFKEKGNGLD
jgi:hypothetical protein